jgi:hypothetical protein
MMSVTVYDNRLELCCSKSFKMGCVLESRREVADECLLRRLPRNNVRKNAIENLKPYSEVSIHNVSVLLKQGEL